MSTNKPADEHRIRCIKLFLDPGQALPKFISKRDHTEEMQRLGKSAVTCASDYLSQVYKHVMQKAKDRYSPTVVNNATINFVLTVPAVWSDAAKNATLMAAKNAGITHNVSTLSGRLDSFFRLPRHCAIAADLARTEPEAAACYTVRAIQPNNLEIGNNIVVCDAGGGTVDLITCVLAH